MEELFNSMVAKDLEKMNELIHKGWYETSDFSEAVLTLSHSLAMYHQEASNENYTQTQRIQESWEAKRA